MGGHLGMKSPYSNRHIDQKDVNNAEDANKLGGLDGYTVTTSKFRKDGHQKNKTLRVDQTIDYIFQRGFDVKTTLKLPTLQQIIEDTRAGEGGKNDRGCRLPSWKAPTDHLPIGAIFEWTDEVKTP